MLTQAMEVMKYVKASAGRAGLNVVFEDCNQPRHDGDRIYLPQITSKTSMRELKQLMASTDHEVAHDRYSSFKVLKELDLNPKSLLMFVWNLLEDSRVNNIEAREYRGFKENWDDCAAELVKIILEKATSDKSNPVGEILASLLFWETKVSAENFPLTEATAHSFPVDVNILDAITPFTDRLVSCHHILDKELGTKATYDLAYDILKSLGKDIKEELKKYAKENPDGVKKKVSSEAKASRTEEEVSDEEDDEFKIITVKVTDEDLEELSLSTTEAKAMSHTGVNFERVEPTKGRHWDMTDYDKFIVVDYPKKTLVGGGDYLKVMGHESGFLMDYKRQVETNLISQENFAQQVRKIIQIRAKVQTQYGTKKGKLDQSRLSRICFDAPGFNERVFKTRIENKTLDAAVTVLVDMSGSMGGQKVLYALASTLLLNEVFTTLNVPLEILGFTDGYNYKTFNTAPTMFIYKGFNNLHVTEAELKEYFSKSSGYMCGNPDGENILWAHDRLVKRKERKKLLIVMSDGSPAASKCSSGLKDFTEKVIKEIEKSKGVDIYGLGLCSNSVTDYYKANSVVSTPQDIPSKLLALIEKRILA